MIGYKADEEEGEREVGGRWWGMVYARADEWVE